MSSSDARYFRVSPKFWSDPMVLAWTEDARTLALYLLTCSHRNTEGLFRIPRLYILADLGWEPERLPEPFQQLTQDRFIHSDPDTEVVMIAKALAWQAPENPNQAKAAARRIAELPRNGLEATFRAACEQYAQRLAEQLPKQFGEPSPQPLAPSNSSSSSCSSSSSSSNSTSLSHARTPAHETDPPNPTTENQNRGVDQDRPDQTPDPIDPTDAYGQAVLAKLPDKAVREINRSDERAIAAFHRALARALNAGITPTQIRNALNEPDLLTKGTRSVAAVAADRIRAILPSRQEANVG